MLTISIVLRVVAVRLPEEPMDVPVRLPEEPMNVPETTTTGMQPQEDFGSRGQEKVAFGACSMTLDNRSSHRQHENREFFTESGALLSAASEETSVPSMSSNDNSSQTESRALLTSPSDGTGAPPPLSSFSFPSSSFAHQVKSNKKMTEDRLQEMDHMLRKAQEENIEKQRALTEKEGEVREKERQVHEERQRVLQAEQERRAAQERHKQELAEERRQRELVEERRRQDLAMLQRQQRSVSQTSRLRDDLPCYSMKRNPRGLAVIISIEHFQRTELNLGSRQGTSVDAGHLERAFKNLNFNVLIHRDCTSSDLVRVMTSYGQRDHSNYDCFVCCLLTHGKKDFIYGSDALPVAVSEILSKVNGLACPSLNLKPKLFFIQACRGSGEDKGVETDSLPRIAQRDAQEQIKIPLGADFLIGYSTAPETVSFRSTTHGSWYICTLVAVLNEYAKEGMSLSDMLTLVNHRLAQATTSEGLKQIPSPINQLTKRLVFTHTTS